MKIAHIGSYNSNIGDNIALKVVRDGVQTHCKENIQWLDLCISKYKNFTKKEIKSSFEDLNKKADALLVGGGGLFEFDGYDRKATGWKLPFDQDTLKSLDVPIFLFAIGVNDFRKRRSFMSGPLKSVAEFLKKCKMVSFRNDGSIKIIKKVMEIEKIQIQLEEIADPGLIVPSYLQKPRLKLCSPSAGCLQPARNTNLKINKGRFINDENSKKIHNFAKNINILSHTLKDFHYSGSHLVPESLFRSMLTLEEVYQFVQFYGKIDFCVPLRGHGQLISVATNTPFISLSTQDKILKFAELNGFSDYNIDIHDSQWYNILKLKIERLCTDEEYLREWYNIRDRNMVGWVSKFDDYCKRVVKAIEIEKQGKKK